MTEGEDEGPQPTPFDHPAFLPVLLWGFTAWFGWDVFTGAEAYQKYPNFNRYGLGFLTAVAVYSTSQAIRPRPLAPAAFWGALALFLGLMGSIGRDWHGETPPPQAFNLYGFAATAALALFFFLRARRAAADPGPPPAD